MNAINKVVYRSRRVMLCDLPEQGFCAWLLVGAQHLWGGSSSDVYRIPRVVNTGIRHLGRKGVYVSSASYMYVRING